MADLIFWIVFYFVALLYTWFVMNSAYETGKRIGKLEADLKAATKRLAEGK